MLCMLAALLLPAPVQSMVLNPQDETPVIGVASFYARGKMEATVRARQRLHDLPRLLPAVHGYVAVLDCTQIGQVVYLRPIGTQQWERFLVADCAGISDGGAVWMRRGARIGRVHYPILVETDWRTAQEWGRGRPFLVEVQE